MTLSVVFAMVVAIIIMLEKANYGCVRYNEIPKLRGLIRKQHTHRILQGGRDYCISYVRMDVGV